MRYLHYTPQDAVLPPLPLEAYTLQYVRRDRAALKHPALQIGVLNSK
jgi:hypothetical protein